MSCAFGAMRSSHEADAALCANVRDVADLHERQQMPQARPTRSRIWMLSVALAIAPAIVAAATDAKATLRPKNVLVILTDDVGFAASTSFGGPIETPTFDALAQQGLRYNNFFTTAYCSPTRAALLTGRNPHAVEMGSITESASADRGYTSEIPKSAATIARVLRDNGYRTAIFGKYHLIPKTALSSVGPFDHWPTSMGFEYFYGFEPAMVDQFEPHLIENTRLLAPPKEPDYFFERDLADRAIHWLRELRATGRNEPFFLYIAPAAAHAPLQAPPDWIAKYRGRFDRGWDFEREAVLARQQRLGIAPTNAVPTPRTAGVPAWDSLSRDEQRIAARMMEAYAGMLSYADHQIGRVLDALRAAGEYDDTLVIYIQGDNGASPEGGQQGVHNYYNSINALGSGRTKFESTAGILRRLDQLGGPGSAPAIPTGWTNALNTPFPGWKTDSSRLGGIRNGVVVSWPAGIRDAGAIRRQFHSVQDVAPTIYEALGITPPATVDGVAQQPLDGRSMLYSFADARAPSSRQHQYFESAGTLGIYSDGWWAGYRTEGDEQLGPDLQSRSAWQLFDLNADFSQSRDLAASQPQKLADLKTLFSAQAQQHALFPIKRARALRSDQIAMEPPGRYVLYPGTERYSDWGFPNIRRRSWSMTAHVELPPDGGSGVIVNQGGRFAGWGLLLQDGVPNFIYRRDIDDASLLRLRTTTPLPPGTHEIAVRFDYEPPAQFGGPDAANVTMAINGTQVAQGRVDATVRFAFMYQGAAIGHSTGSPLLDEYSGPFAFTGKIDRVEFELGPR
jgi:arylsulfatase A-like enzyme